VSSRRVSANSATTRTRAKLAAGAPSLYANQAFMGGQVRREETKQPNDPLMFI
jgi:hypothetical protein